MHIARSLLIVSSIAAFSMSAPALAQSSLANSGNLLGTGSGGVVGTTGTQPRWPGDPHQSATAVRVGAGTSGGGVNANGGDLAPSVVASKTASAPVSNPTLGNRGVSVIGQVGTQQDNNLRSGVLGRGFVTTNNGSQQSTTFREVDVNPTRALGSH